MYTVVAVSYKTLKLIKHYTTFPNSLINFAVHRPNWFNVRQHKDIKAKRSCQAELLAQDGRPKYNAYFVTRAFAHNIRKGDAVSRHTLSETIRLTSEAF